MATLVYKLTKDANLEDLEENQRYLASFTDHGKALFYNDASGNPFTASYIMATGDPIADLTENMAAEQKARSTYNHLIDLSDDPGVKDALRFLRQREIVHFQRFGEALNQVQEDYACRKIY